jgi:LPS sulfotransferase NodH
MDVGYQVSFIKTIIGFMDTISEIFTNPALDEQLLEQLNQAIEPRSRFIIAITPRSGSTYLCDAMKNTNRLGRPQELLGAISIANRIGKNIPGRTPEEYLRNGIKATRSPVNNVSGLKASWFQFEKFTQAMTDRSYLKGFKYIYLTRRDLAAQAVSLYKATASEVFHSNIDHSSEALQKLESLQYDYKQIKYWYDHILVQEKGWQRYFYENRIYPYCISYEDIEEDILTILKRMAFYVSVDPNNIHLPQQVSSLQKIGDERNRDWALRFQNQLTLGAAH